MAMLEVSAEKDGTKSYKRIGVSPFIKVSKEFIDSVGLSTWDNEIQLGQFELIFLEYLWREESVLYVRKDRFSALMVWFYEKIRPLYLIYRTWKPRVDYEKLIRDKS